MILDVTNARQILACVEKVQSLDLLINNAGINLTRSSGAIVNNLSMLALAPLPVTPAYAVSKAAAFNLTRYDPRSPYAEGVS